MEKVILRGLSRLLMYLAVRTHPDIAHNNVYGRKTSSTIVQGGGLLEVEG